MSILKFPYIEIIITLKRLEKPGRVMAAEDSDMSIHNIWVKLGHTCECILKQNLRLNPS